MKKNFILPVLVLMHFFNVSSEVKKSTAELDLIVEKYVTSGSPGLVVAVSSGDEIVYKKVLGMADLERHVPLSEESVFHLASCGKQFTGFSILLLEERGLLSPEDDIRKFLPWMPKYEKIIRIKHLLNHSSGIRDYAMMLLFSGRRWINFYPTEEIIDLIVAQKGLNNHPGDEFIYSNSNYFLLGLIIEKISGMTQREFLEKNIFIPLKMEKTLFVDNIYEIIKNRALGYSPDNGPGFVPEISLMVNAGDGSVFSCVNDLMKWQNNFNKNILGNRGKLLIKRAEKSGLLNDGESSGYSAGLFIGKYRGNIMVSHGGGWAGYRTEMIRFPEEKLSIICLANLGSINTYELSMKIADVFLKERGKRREANLPEEEILPPGKPVIKKAEKINLAEYTGIYYSEELNKDYLVELSGEKLIVKISGLHFDLVLKTVRKDVFGSVSPEFKFIRDKKGEISGFFMGENSTRNIMFRKVVQD